jgi:Arc/MetJ-type ribon-helix-helix transcriptional regulator
MSKMITLRISEDRKERLDALVAEGAFPNRAAALTAALDRLLADEARRAIDRAIVEGYTRVPPTPEEDAYAEASGRRSIADEPW